MGTKPFTLKNGIQTLQRDEDGAVWLDESKGSSRSGWFMKDPSGRIVQAPATIEEPSAWTKGVSSKLSRADIDMTKVGAFTPFGPLAGLMYGRAARYLNETFSPNGTNVYKDRKQINAYQDYTAPTVEAGAVGNIMNASTDAAGGFTGGLGAAVSLVGRMAGEGTRALGDIAGMEGVKGFGQDIAGYFNRVNTDPEHTFSGNSGVGKAANLVGEIASYAGPAAAARAMQAGGAVTTGLNLLAQGQKAILPMMVGESTFGGFNQARDQGATKGEAALAGAGKGAVTGLILGVGGKVLDKLGLNADTAHSVVRDVLGAASKAGIMAAGDTAANNFIDNALARSIGQRTGLRPEEIRQSPWYHGFFEKLVPFIGFELGHVAGNRAGLHPNHAPEAPISNKEAGAAVAEGQAPIQVEHGGLTFRHNPADKSTVVIGPDGRATSINASDPVHMDGLNKLMEAFSAAEVTTRPDGSLTTQAQAQAEAARAQADMNPYGWALQRRATELEQQARLQNPIAGNMGFVQGGPAQSGLGPERTLNADIRAEVNPQGTESPTAPAFQQQMPGTAPAPEGLGMTDQRRVTVSGEGNQATAPGHQVQVTPGLPGAQGVDTANFQHGFTSNGASADARYRGTGLPPGRGGNTAHALVAGGPAAPATELVRTGPTEHERVRSEGVQQNLGGARSAMEAAGKPSEYPGSEPAAPKEGFTQDRVRNTIVAGNDNLQADPYPREATEAKPGLTPDRVKNTIVAGNDAKLVTPPEAPKPEAAKPEAEPVPVKVEKAEAPKAAASDVKVGDTVVSPVGSEFTVDKVDPVTGEATLRRPGGTEAIVSKEVLATRWTKPAGAKPAEASKPQAEQVKPPESLEEVKAKWQDRHESGPEIVQELASWGDNDKADHYRVELSIQKDLRAGVLDPKDAKEMLLDLVAARVITPTDARAIDKNIGITKDIERQRAASNPITKLAQEASAAIDGAKDEISVRRAANDLVKAIAEKGIKTWHEFVDSVRHGIGEAGTRTMNALERAWDRLAKTLGLKARNGVTFDASAAEAARKADLSEAEADAYGKMVGQVDAVRGAVGEGKEVEIVKNMMELPPAKDGKDTLKQYDSLQTGKRPDGSDVRVHDTPQQRKVRDELNKQSIEILNRRGIDVKDPKVMDALLERYDKDPETDGGRAFIGDRGLEYLLDEIAKENSNAAKLPDPRVREDSQKVSATMLNHWSKGVAERLAKGEGDTLWVVLGQPGAGKSTALKLLSAETSESGKPTGSLGAFELVGTDNHQYALENTVSNIEALAKAMGNKNPLKVKLALVMAPPEDVGHRLVDRGVSIHRIVDPSTSAVFADQAYNNAFRWSKLYGTNGPDIYINRNNAQQEAIHSVPAAESKAWLKANHPDVIPDGYTEERTINGFNERVKHHLDVGTQNVTGGIPALLHDVLSTNNTSLGTWGDGLYDKTHDLYKRSGEVQNNAQPGSPGQLNQEAGSGEARRSGVDEDGRVPAAHAEGAAAEGQGVREPGLASPEVKGEIEFHDKLRSTITLHQNADPSTILHETFHAIRRRLQSLNPELHATVEKAFGVKDGKWTVHNEEHFARAAERYAHEGIFPTNAIEQAMGFYRDALRGVYGDKASGTDIGVELTPQQRIAFGQIIDPQASTRVKVVESPLTAAMDAVRYGARNFSQFVSGMRESMGNKAFEAFRAKNGGTKGLMEMQRNLTEAMAKPVDEEMLLAGAHDKTMADATGKASDELGSVHSENILKEVADKLFQVAPQQPAAKPKELEFRGKDFASRLERFDNLPTRLDQKSPQTFGWVHSSIERFNHSIHVHESTHGEVRESLSKLTPQERRKVFEYQAENRFKDNGDDTRGYIPTDVELKKEGFTPEMVSAYHDTLGDYAAQINKVSDLMKSKLQELKVSQAFDRAQLGKDLDAATDPKAKADIQAKLDGMDGAVKRAEAKVAKYEDLIKREKAYVPLIRDGNYFKQYRDKATNELLAIVAGNTPKELAKKAAIWEKANPELLDPNKTEITGRYDDRTAQRPIATNADQATVIDAAEAAGLSKDEAYKLAEMFDLQAREYKSLRGFKRHMKEAEGIPGYEIDPEMAHSRYTAAMARFQAGLKHGGEIENRIAKLHDDGHTEMENYLRNLHRDVLNNPVNPLIGKVMQVVSMKSLGLNPGFVAQQVAQKFSHDLPTLVSVYGKDAYRYWAKAGKIATAHLLSEDVVIKPEDIKGLVADPKAIADDLNRSLKEAAREGIFMSPDLAENARAKKGIGIGGGKFQEAFDKASVAMDKIQEQLFWFISKSENHNRRQTYIAQYLMARELGFPAEKGFDPNVEPDKIGRATGADMIKLGHDAAQRLTEKQIAWIHNERGVANRSEFQRAANGLGMIPTQYRYFLMEYMQQMKQIYQQGYERRIAQGKDPVAARAEAALPVAMSVGAMSAAAGFHGLPMLGMMIMAATKLWNDGLGPLFGADPLRSPERFAQKHGVPRWLFSGLPTLFNYNMENAIGVGDPLNLSRKDKAMDIALKVGLGPTQGLIEDAGKTWHHAMQGNALKAVSTMPVVPKGISNAAKALSGEATMPDGGKIKMTPGERIGVGLGFRSDRLNQISDEVSQIMDEKQNAQSFVQGASALRPGVLGGYNRSMVQQGRRNEIVTGPMVQARINKDSEAKMPKATAQALQNLGFRQR